MMVNAWIAFKFKLFDRMTQDTQGQWSQAQDCVSDMAAVGQYNLYSVCCCFNLFDVSINAPSNGKLPGAHLNA